MITHTDRDGLPENGMHSAANHRQRHETENKTIYWYHSISGEETGLLTQLKTYKYHQLLHSSGIDR